jgi:hypothetical protein
MRTTKELLSLVKQTIQEKRVSGICAAITLLAYKETIPPEEHYKLNSFIKTTLPPRIFDEYCWKMYEKEPRIKWLDEQILLLESYGLEEKV